MKVRVHITDELRHAAVTALVSSLGFELVEAGAELWIVDPLDQKPPTGCLALVGDVSLPRLRRHLLALSAAPQIAGAAFDRRTRTLTRGDHVIRLTVIEANLLEYLADADRPVAASELLAQVWGFAEGVVTRTLVTTVGRLRKKIEPEPRTPTYLKTVHGLGYQLVSEAPPGPPTNIGDVEPLLGRDDAIDALTKKFASGTRLVTVLGEGGLGKTHLVRAFARQARNEFAPGGAWFVNLSAARTAEDAFAVTARTLGVADVEPWRIARVVTARGRMLLVLDNAEQVEDPVTALLDDWIQLVPTLHILVTSRRPLEARSGETLALRPLPDAAARALYLRHARRWRTPDDEEVERAVSATEGVPLAIILAASQRSPSDSSPSDLTRLIDSVWNTPEGTSLAALSVSWDRSDDRA